VAKAEAGLTAPLVAQAFRPATTINAETEDQSSHPWRRSEHGLPQHGLSQTDAVRVVRVVHPAANGRPHAVKTLHDAITEIGSRDEPPLGLVHEEAAVAARPVAFGYQLVQKLGELVFEAMLEPRTNA